MAGRRTNLALLALLVVTGGTGVAAFAIGTSAVSWVLVAHGVGAVAIVALAPWKSTIVRRGLHRSRPGRWASLVLTAAVLVAIGTGVSFSTGLATSLGAISVMQLHVGSAVVAAVSGLAHVLTRKQPMRIPAADRRVFVRTAGLAVVATAGYVILEGITNVARLPGADRRGTGSHERGSFDPLAMPVTSWLNDVTPDIDASRHEVEVTTKSGTTAYPVRALDGDDVLVSTLDCTGGWYATQEWQGTVLAALVGPIGESVRVISATGYERRFPIEAAPDLLLATRVAGSPLSPGHGAPLRLVAPGRRGFWWVKWVSQIVVDDRPSWWQPPFPLT